MARKKKALNKEGRVRALELAQPAEGSNPVALAMGLRGGHGAHGDARKAASRNACRGKVESE